MLMSSITLALAIATLHPQSRLDASAPASGAGVEGLFSAADAADAPEADGVVALILGASAELAQLDGDAFHQLADRLEPYSRRAFFSPEELPGQERLGVTLHTVQSGELPGRIARGYRIGAGLLAWLNAGYDERKLRAGQKLKVLDLSDESLQLTIDRGRYRLAAWRKLPDGSGWVLMAYIPIGVGASETATPTGRTKITKRVLDPQWTHPVTKQVFAPDDPGNLLGGYWVALDSEGIGKQGIGLHGYTGDTPEVWLEKQSSNGCLRLLQPDMDRLFHLALEGTAVTITP